MRASLVTDVAQSVTCIGFLIGLVIVLGVNAPASFGSWNPGGMHLHTLPAGLIDPACLSQYMHLQTYSLVTSTTPVVIK